MASFSENPALVGLGLLVAVLEARIGGNLMETMLAAMGPRDDGKVVPLVLHQMAPGEAAAIEELRTCLETMIAAKSGQPYPPTTQ